MNEPENELLAPGHRTCAGCGPAIAIRQMLRATGKNVVICEATGCMEVTSTAYPETSWKVPWIHVLFENVSSVASGVKEALIKQGKDDVKVIALAGDGGMVDIGFRALSGAMERGHDVLFLCYDNEAYMNTGVQRSGATPFGAATTTSPAGTEIAGKQEWKKNVPFIAVAHGLKYVATASIAYPEDFQAKIKKALSIKGPKYLHVHCPCPVGWGCDGAKTIKYAKAAVETGLWALYEIEEGKLKLNTKPSELKPAEEYLRGQRRFKHLKEEDIKKIEKHAKQRFDHLLELENSEISLLKVL
ncbi:pyruvate synthase subunit beta [archaeon]|nr:pyruvate synthase subunit beta [archaeon]